MQPKRLIVVVGARPNFIKVGPLIPTLLDAGLDVSVAHTGQHYDHKMSDVFFSDLEIPEPKWMLGVGSGTHAVQTASAMVALEELFAAERPDAVIVVGDVNSTLAGALAAVKLGVPVVHLESGLRSRDMSMPEEVNRIVTDQLSALLLTPTREADDNLIAEGVEPSRIRFVGNIMAESLVRNEVKARARGVCAQLGMTPGGYVLTTCHRPENTDHPERLSAIVRALHRVEMPVVFPVHPRSRPLLEAAGVGEGTNMILVDPVGYLDMLSLQADAAVVVTDSGGMQEETCMLGTPCVTVRRNTEREITCDVGANRLVAAEEAAVLEGVRAALAAPKGWTPPERWDGEVSRRVADALLEGFAPLSGF